MTLLAVIELETWGGEGALETNCRGSPDVLGTF